MGTHDKSNEHGGDSTFEHLKTKLSHEEQRSLHNAIEALHDDLLKRLVTDVRKYLLGIAGVATLWGWFSFHSLREDVVHAAAKKLSGDESLKATVIGNAEKEIFTPEQIAEIVKANNETKAKVAASWDDLEKAIKEARDKLDSNAAALSSELADEFKDMSDMVRHLPDPTLRKESVPQASAAK